MSPQLAIPDLKHRVQGLVSLHFVRENLHCIQADATLVRFAIRRACCISSDVCTVDSLEMARNSVDSADIIALSAENDVNYEIALNAILAF